MRLPQVPPTRARSWDWWGRGGLEGGGRSEGRRRKSSPLPTTPVYGWGGGSSVGAGRENRAGRLQAPRFLPGKGRVGMKWRMGSLGRGGGNPRLCSPQGPTLVALTFWRIWPEVETLRMSFCGEPDSCSGSLSDDSSAAAVGAAAVAPAWGCEAPAAATAAAAAAAMLHGKEQGGQRHLAPQAAPCKRLPCVCSAEGERSRQAGWRAVSTTALWRTGIALAQSSRPLSEWELEISLSHVNKRLGFSVR